MFIYDPYGINHAHKFLQSYEDFLIYEKKTAQFLYLTKFANNPASAMTYS